MYFGSAKSVLRWRVNFLGVEMAKALKSEAVRIQENLILKQRRILCEEQARLDMLLEMLDRIKLRESVVRK